MDRRSRTLVLLASALAVTVLTTGAAGVAEAQNTRFPADIQEQVEAYRQAHPTDLEGLDAFQQSLGAEPMQVYVGAEASGPVGAAEAERLLAAPSSMMSNASLAADVPIDAFDVFLTVTRYADPYVNQVNAVGSWNYRDDYVNGSAPENISSLARSTTCYTTGNTYLNAYDYQGNDYSSQTYLSDGGLNGTTVGRVRDVTSGFALLTDNGTHSTWYEAAVGCEDFAAEYRYEHNQDGNGITSISADLGVLTVSYDPQPLTLQKATSVVTPTPAS